MGNGHGRLRGAIALTGHRSTKERSSNQVRQIESRETRAIVDAELDGLAEALTDAENLEAFSGAK